MNETPSLGRAFDEGWKGFQKYIGLAIGAFLVYMVIEFVIGVIPYCGSVINIFVSPVIAGGFILLTLKIIRDTNPEFNDLFWGFKNNYWQFIGGTLLLGLIVMACYIPGGIIFGIGALIGEKAIVPFAIIGGIVAIVVAIVVILRWVFVIYLIADNENEGRILPAFEKSAKMTEGRRGEIFVTLFVFGLLALAGVIALGIGLLFTAPLSTCCTVAYYNQFKRMYFKEAPHAAATQTPGEGIVYEEPMKPLSGEGG